MSGQRGKNKDLCKFCKRSFETAPNPLVKNPGHGDLLKRRCANGKDCRACYNFIKGHAEYSEFTGSGLAAHLDNGNNQEVYNTRFEEYCSGVREGTKRARKRGALFSKTC